jgi:hypothetical protein
VIHDPTLNEIKGQAENFWRTLIDILNRMGETVKAPNLILEQLQIVFRDESMSVAVILNLILIVSLFSRQEQHIFRAAGARCWRGQRVHDRNMAGKKNYFESNYEVSGMRVLLKHRQCDAMQNKFAASTIKCRRSGESSRCLS